MAYQGAVFIVDDKMAPRESLRMILPPLCGIPTAEDGQEAPLEMSDKEIELETVGMKMPGLAGIDVLGEIQETGADIDVIIISRKAKDLGFIGEEEIEKIMIH